MNENNASQVQQGNWIGRYPKGLKIQNGEHSVNLCESNNLETQVIFHSELARTLFLVECINNIKIKMLQSYS